MKIVKIIKLFCLMAGFALIGCSEEEDSQINNKNGDLVVNNNSEDLSVRILVTSDTVDVISDDSNGKTEKTFTLIKTSELSSPEVNGETLMANSLDMRNSLIAVSYNLRGDVYGGAVDLMVLSGDNLKLTSQVVAGNADVNATYFDGSRLYLAGAATGSDSTAYIYQLIVKDNKLVTESAMFSWLGGHTATGLVEEGKYIYVTTGDNETTGGGLHTRSQNDLSFSSYKPLHDARWVDIKDKKIYVQQGTPGNLSVIELDDNSQIQQFGFTGLNTPESKSTFDISGDLIFLASGYDGVQIINRNTGATVGQIAIPEEDSSVDMVSNSVTVEGNKIFISNGESVIAAQFDNKNAANPNPVILGTLDLGDHQSINHVRFRSNRLVVASGLGGVKIIKLVNK
ncbi:hypothetical protein [Reichenbachiella sp.]|uniref:hypothetical protein n=2 Tax=Reichenbachiella sp. TaxID=2184521 RepID=UPI003297BF23